MIKNLITATLLATATPLMANAGTYRSAATITTDGTPYSNVVENVSSEYYYLKRANIQNPLNGTSIQIIGYQYTKCEYQDAETGWYTGQTLDYYIITDNTNTNLTEIEYMLTGNINNNGIEFENLDYEVTNITKNTAKAKIDGLLLGIATFGSLNSLRTETEIGTPILLNDAGETYATLLYDHVYNYIRFRNTYSFYTNSNVVADAVQATQDLYTQLTVKVDIGRTPTPTPNYEVIDIGGLMFEILGMPFAWASIAFNLTLFPGTAYAINISRLFFAVLGSLILIIILKKVLK